MSLYSRAEKVMRPALCSETAMDLLQEADATIATKDAEIASLRDDLARVVEPARVIAAHAADAMTTKDMVISALLDTIASLRSKLEEAEGAQPKNIEKTADQLAASLGVLLRDWLTGPKPLEGDGLEHVIKLRIHRLLTEAALASLREADHA